MTKTIKILIICLAVIGIIFILIFADTTKKDLNPTQTNAVPSNSAHDEFLSLMKTAHPIEKVKTSVESIDNSQRICDYSSPDKNCLTFNVTIGTQEWQQSFIGFIKKPIEGNLYQYEQTGDMNLIVEYSNENWQIPDIEYLRNAQIGISKIESSPYLIFSRSDGDACSASTTYIVDPKMPDFPYWIDLVYTYDTCDDSKNMEELHQSAEKEFLNTLVISK